MYRPMSPVLASPRGSDAWAHGEADGEKKEASNFEKYEGLEFWEPYNAERRAYLVDAKKNKSSVMVLRWTMFGVIGILVGIISVLMKQSVERVGMERFHETERLLAFEKQLTADANASQRADGSYNERADTGNIVLSGVFWTLTSMVCIAVSSALIVYLEPKAAGSGLPEVMTYLNGVQMHRTFSFRVMVVKFLSCFFAVSSGLPVGPEGPMIHLGSMVGAVMTKKNFVCKEGFKRFQNTMDRRGFMTCGAACGVSAAFGAPLGGTLFVMEEIASYWDKNEAWTIFFAGAISYFVVATFQSMFHGWHIKPAVHFGEMTREGSVLFQPDLVPKEVNMNLLVIFPSMVVGAMCGLAGAFFTRWNLKVVKWRRRVVNPVKWQRVAEPTALALIYGLITFLTPLLSSCKEIPADVDNANGPFNFHVLSSDGAGSTIEFTRFVCESPDTYSPLATLNLNIGEASVKHMFSKGTQGYYTLPSMIVYLCIYYFFALYAAGSAFATGIVIPMLTIGSVLGRIVAEVFHDHIGLFENEEWMDPGIFALVGAAGFFAGVSRLTFPLIVIMIEISHEVHYFPPMFVAIITAKWVADYFEPHSLYHALIEMNEAPFLSPSDEATSASQCELYTARSAMATRVVTLHQVETVGAICDALNSRHCGFPIVDDHGRLTGVCLRVQLESILYKQNTRSLRTRKSLANVKGLRKEVLDMLAAEAFNPHKVREQRQAFMVHAHKMTAEDRAVNIDLRPFMNRSPFAVHDHFRFNLVKIMFMSMNVRHMVVVDNRNTVVGMITRKDIVTLDHSISHAHGDDDDAASIVHSGSYRGALALPGAGHDFDDDDDIMDYEATTLVATPLQTSKRFDGRFADIPAKRTFTRGGESDNRSVELMEYVPDGGGGGGDGGSALHDTAHTDSPRDRGGSAAKKRRVNIGGTAVDDPLVGSTPPRTISLRSPTTPAVPRPGGTSSNALGGFGASFTSPKLPVGHAHKTDILTSPTSPATATIASSFGHANASTRSVPRAMQSHSKIMPVMKAPFDTATML